MSSSLLSSISWSGLTNNRTQEGTVLTMELPVFFEDSPWTPDEREREKTGSPFVRRNDIDFVLRSDREQLNGIGTSMGTSQGSILTGVTGTNSDCR